MSKPAGKGSGGPSPTRPYYENVAVPSGTGPPPLLFEDDGAAMEDKVLAPKLARKPSTYDGFNDSNV